MAFTRMIHLIPPQSAANFWPIVGHWCEDALSHGGGDLLNLQDIVTAVAQEEMQLWIIAKDDKITAVTVTEIRTWPRAKVLTAVIVAGENMHEWVEELDAELVAFGRHNGCTILDAHGRNGWKKSLAALGWKLVTVSYAKEI